MNFKEALEILIDLDYEFSGNIVKLGKTRALIITDMQYENGFEQLILSSDANNVLQVTISVLILKEHNQVVRNNITFTLGVDDLSDADFDMDKTLLSLYVLRQMYNMFKGIIKDIS